MSQSQQFINTFPVIADIVENRSRVGSHFDQIGALKAALCLADLKDDDSSMREQLVQLLQIGEVVKLHVLVLEIKQDVSWLADVCVTCDERILQDFSQWVFIEVEKDLLVRVGLSLEVELQKDQVFKPTAIGCCYLRGVRHSHLNPAIEIDGQLSEEERRLQVLVEVDEFRPFREPEL